MMKMHKELFKGLKKEIKNNGDNLTITLSGEPEQIAKLEKKMNAMQELFDGEEGCCGACC